MSEENKLTFDEWMKIGIESNWCGPPVCYTHDGLPMSEAEYQDFLYDGNDTCIHVVRMYESPEHKMEIEQSHSPSEWRNHYTGENAVERYTEESSVDPF